MLFLSLKYVSVIELYHLALFFETAITVAAAGGFTGFSVEVVCAAAVAATCTAASTCVLSRAGGDVPCLWSS